jgi:acyl-CoA thioesterase I
LSRPVTAQRIEDLARAGRPAGRLVVCLGDSITQGQVSSNWADRLQAAHADDGVRVVNAGINGELTWNVLQRLDTVIALQPDAVVLLIGTNDVGFAHGPKMEAMYRRNERLPPAAQPSPGWFEECLAQVFDRLGAETSARIAVFEIPMNGEDLTSAQNERVRTYNAALHRIAGERDIPVLPLYERLVALLPADHQARPYNPTIWLMISSAIRRSVLRRNWDQVSAANGFAVLIDGIHLNDRAASVVTELADRFLAYREDAG